MEPKSVAPGLTSVIESGETWEIEDREGKTFEIRAVVDEKTMAFVLAFDLWYTTKQAGVTGIVLDSSWDNLKKCYESLPAHVLHQLPSIKALGLRIAHEHA